MYSHYVPIRRSSNFKDFMLQGFSDILEMPHQIPKYKKRYLGSGQRTCCPKEFLIKGNRLSVKNKKAFMQDARQAIRPLVKQRHPQLSLLQYRKASPHSCTKLSLKSNLHSRVPQADKASITTGTVDFIKATNFICLPSPTPTRKTKPSQTQNGYQWKLFMVDVTS